MLLKSKFLKRIKLSSYPSLIRIVQPLRVMLRCPLEDITWTTIQVRILFNRTVNRIRTVQIQKVNRISMDRKKINRWDINSLRFKLIKGHTSKWKIISSLWELYKNRNLLMKICNTNNQQMTPQCCIRNASLQILVSPLRNDSLSSLISWLSTTRI